MKPSHCPQCRRVFMANPVLQAEMRFLAAKHGADYAEHELNNRLEEEHGSHHGLSWEDKLDADLREFHDDPMLKRFD